MSKLITLSADETTATVSGPVMADLLSTTFSTTSAVTGTYGLAQKAALVVLGMAIQNNRLNRGWNPFSAAPAA